MSKGNNNTYIIGIVLVFAIVALFGHFNPTNKGVGYGNIGVEYGATSPTLSEGEVSNYITGEMFHKRSRSGPSWGSILGGCSDSDGGNNITNPGIVT